MFQSGNCLNSWKSNQHSMPKKHLSKKKRKAVFDRAKGLCEYCQSQAVFSVHSFSVEHIIPLSKGGTNELENLALACEGCNNAKRTHTEGIDPETQLTAPFFHPRKHQWKDHFKWGTESMKIIGTTPIGRVTITCLNMNRKPLVNLRRAVAAIGEHPPEIS